MPNKRNTELLTKTKEILKDGKALYFADFTGITVAKLESFRREIKKSKGNFVVIKNTLGPIALKELGYETAPWEGVFTGATGIAIAYDDPIILAKLLKDNASMKIKGGIIEGQYYDAAGVVRFARIPPKPVLYAHVVGSLNLLGSLAETLEGVLRNMIYTLDAMKSKEAK